MQAVQVVEYREDILAEQELLIGPVSHLQTKHLIFAD